jgi:hypothetical protein
MRELPTWWIKYYQNGRPIRESTRTTKETVARRILRSREGDVEHGIPINPKMGRVTFEEAADDILNDYRANHRRSLDGVLRRLRLHLKPYFRGRLLVSVTTADVRAYIAKRKADVITTGTGETEKSRTVSNAEINNELKVLGRMFSLAVESGKLAYKPKIPMLKRTMSERGSSRQTNSTRCDAVCPPTCNPW